MANYAKFDIKQMEEYRDKLIALEKDLDSFYAKAAKNIALKAIRKIKKRTPKDEGTLKNAWQIANVRQVGDSVVATITNNTDYASDVEYGHRVRGKQKSEGKKRKRKKKAKRRKLAGASKRQRYEQKIKRLSKREKEAKPKKPVKHHGYVPGVYMMTTGMIEIEREMERLLDKELQKYLKGKLG